LNHSEDKERFAKPQILVEMAKSKTRNGFVNVLLLAVEDSLAVPVGESFRRC
jgi:hypothetical protein